MTDLKIQGTVNDTKGKVKEGAGELTGDRDLEREGQVDQLQGQLQKGVGDVQTSLQDTADRVKEEVDKHR